MSPPVQSGVQGKHIPPDVVCDIVEMLRAGMPVCDTCRKADVSEYAVRCIAKRFGIKPVSVKGRRARVKPAQLRPVMDLAQYWRGQAFNMRWRQLGE